MTWEITDLSFGQMTVSSWEHGFRSAGDGLGDDLQARSHAARTTVFNSEHGISQTWSRHIQNLQNLRSVNSYYD